MVWIPGAEEIPMSVMVSDKKDRAAVTIRKHGFGSTALFNKRGWRDSWGSWPLWKSIQNWYPY